MGLSYFLHEPNKNFQRIKKWGYLRRLSLIVVSIAVLAACSSRDGPGSTWRVDSNYKDAVPKVEPLASGSNKPYTIRGKRYVPDTREVAYEKRGVASWYGKHFHGKKTSNGEVFDMYGMTAAHTTLPIPSYVHVTNLKNGRSVIVRVNDRGPFVDNRIIDLSYAVATHLGFVNEGTAQVIVRRILPADIRAGRIPSTTANPKGGGQVQQPMVEPTWPTTDTEVMMGQNTSTDHATTGALSGGFYIQIGAFQSSDNAYNVKNRLSATDAQLATKLRVNQEGGIYKVYAGPYVSEGQAQDASWQIEQQLGDRVLVLDRR